MLLLSDICLDNRALVLQEQTLFKYEDLQHHLDQGEYDEDGILLVYHPFCDVEPSLCML